MGSLTQGFRSLRDMVWKCGVVLALLLLAITVEAESGHFDVWRDYPQQEICSYSCSLHTILQHMGWWLFHWFYSSCENYAESRTWVTVGEHNICNGVNEGGQKIGVEQFIVHHGYNCKKRVSKDDIALLKLKSDINFTNKVKAATLPDASKTYGGWTSTVAGWGGTVQYNSGQKPTNQNISCVLKSTDLKILDNNCKKMKGVDFKKQLCASEQGTSSCQGDSGGPLIVSKDVVVGVVSYGSGCADQTQNYPGVYTRVSYYLDWINNNT